MPNTLKLPHNLLFVINRTELQNRILETDWKEIKAVGSSLSFLLVQSKWMANKVNRETDTVIYISDILRPDRKVKHTKVQIIRREISHNKWGIHYFFFMGREKCKLWHCSFRTPSKDSKVWLHAYSQNAWKASKPTNNRKLKLILQL